MSHWTKELLDLDFVTWSELSADMSPGISSALTLNLLTWASRKSLDWDPNTHSAWASSETGFRKPVFASPMDNFHLDGFPPALYDVVASQIQFMACSCLLLLGCQSPIPVANTTPLKQPHTVFPSWYWKINHFHAQRTRTAFNYFLS